MLRAAMMLRAASASKFSRVQWLVVDGRHQRAKGKGKSPGPGVVCLAG
jgi:hypothetical protein